VIFFYLLIGVMPLSQHHLWGATVGEATVFKYLGAVCVLYAVFYLASRKGIPPFFDSWQARLFFLLWILAAVSNFTKTLSSAPLSDPFLSYTSFLFLLFVTVSVVDSLRRLHNVLLVAIGSVAFASLYVIREWQKYHGLYADFRPGWVVGDPNYFTISALLCLPLAFYLMLRAQWRWERWFCLGCLLVTLLAVTLAASRGGFLGLVAGFLFVVWRSRRRLRNLALIGALLIPLSLLWPASPLQRLLHPTHSDVEAGDSRLVAWKAGLHMIRDYPVTGVGLGNFKPMMVRYTPAGESVDSVAHNSYIEIAAELGLPILLVFLTMLYFSFRTLGRVRRAALRSGAVLLGQAALGLQAGLLGYAVAAFFLSAEYQKLFWLVIFLSSCLPALAHSTVGASEPKAIRPARGSVEDGELAGSELALLRNLGGS
jgi:O-antigen ligase